MHFKITANSYVIVILVLTIAVTKQFFSLITSSTIFFVLVGYLKAWQIEVMWTLTFMVWKIVVHISFFPLNYVILFFTLGKDTFMICKIGLTLLYFCFTYWTQLERVKILSSEYIFIVYIYLIMSILTRFKLHRFE